MTKAAAGAPVKARSRAKVPVVAPVEAPVEHLAEERWHPIAREWFESLGKSGQSQFYEASDWAHARFIGELLSRSLSSRDGRVSGQLVTAILAGMTELLTTEGARRRARVELERDKPVEIPASVAIMEGYRRAAGRK